MKVKPEKSLGEMIRNMREERKYSQLYMAKKLRVTQQAYCNMEKNPENISLKKLNHIAILLNTILVNLLAKNTRYLEQNYGQIVENDATQMVEYYIEEELVKMYKRLLEEINILKKHYPIP